MRRNGFGDDDPSDWYRHISKGGWPFSTPDNAWPVSDCTSEALKVAKTAPLSFKFQNLVNIDITHFAAGSHYDVTDATNNGG